MNRVAVFSSVDGFQSGEIRRLQEAARHGEVHLLLPSDEAVRAVTGQSPKFPFAERLYLGRALCFVREVHPWNGGDFPGFKPDAWVRGPGGAWPLPPGAENVIQLAASDLAGFPEPELPPATGRPKVVVTGCYDWLHSGHVAFFEEAAALGELHVCLGNDVNIEALKGKGHPLFNETERRYLVGAVRFVHRAYISKGMGQLDAEEEILNIIRPAIYAVNEDGHKPEKAAFCAAHGIRYEVLKRVPKAGLEARSSTALRGF